jgi:hypothetical protein
MAGAPPRPAARKAAGRSHQAGSRGRQVATGAAKSATDFTISLGYPRRLAMGFTANFLVQFIPPGDTGQAAQRLAQLFGDTEALNVTAEGKFQPGWDVEVELSSAAAEFSAAKRVTVSDTGFDLAFWCRPRDSAAPGNHGGILTVQHSGTSTELLSMPFALNIVPYGIAKVSRPLLRRIITVALVLGSTATLGYSLVKQTNEAMGVLTGLLGGALSGIIETRTAALYTRAKVAVKREV